MKCACSRSFSSAVVIFARSPGPAAATGCTSRDVWVVILLLQGEGIADRANGVDVAFYRGCCPPCQDADTAPRRARRRCSARRSHTHSTKSASRQDPTKKDPISQYDIGALPVAQFQPRPAMVAKTAVRMRFTEPSRALIGLARR